MFSGAGFLSVYHVKELGVTKLLRLPCPAFDDTVKTAENVVFLIKPQKRIVEGALEALRYTLYM